MDEDTGAAEEIEVDTAGSCVIKAAAPSRPVATVAMTERVPLVAVVVGLGPTLNVEEKAMTMEVQVAVSEMYSVAPEEEPT